MTRNTVGSVYAEADIQDVIDIDAAIYDLPAFLSILSLVGEDAEVTVSKDQTSLVIKTQRSTVMWPLADESTIAFPTKPIPFPVAKLTVELRGDDMQQMMRVANGLKIDTFTISSDGERVKISGYNAVVDSSLTKVLYSLDLGPNPEQKEFKFVLNKDNLKLIQSDYKVLLWAEERDGKNRFACKFEGPIVSYVIAPETGSEHKF